MSAELSLDGQRMGPKVSVRADNVLPFDFIGLSFCRDG